jgi:hypothetical protein
VNPMHDGAYVPEPLRWVVRECERLLALDEQAAEAWASDPIKQRALRLARQNVMERT